MPSTLTCACCQRAYDPLYMLKCSICKKSYKNTCVDISNNEVRLVSGNKGYDWSCIKCREFGSELRGLKTLILKLQDDINELKTVNATLNQMPNAALDFEQVVSEINDRNNR